MAENNEEAVQKTVDQTTNTTKDQNAEELAEQIKIAEAENKQSKKTLQGIAKEKDLTDAQDTAALSQRLAEVLTENEQLRRQLSETKKADTVIETAATVTAPQKTTKPFTYNKKKYYINHAKVVIPGLGERTAQEILADKDAQKWLVDNQSGFISEEAD